MHNESQVLAMFSDMNHGHETCSKRVRLLISLQEMWQVLQQ